GGVEQADQRALQGLSAVPPSAAERLDGGSDHSHSEALRAQGRSAKRQYPHASFFINCTGDVCRNDVVLFNQRISTRSISRHEKKAMHGEFRLVAGRVVSESYGVKKQQHTFTVEVFWSSGLHALALMMQLLVKGRVLYRHKTFRQ
ncbi:unnamed protein product, partial [Closterium sp. Naga37s-1]